LKEANESFRAQTLGVTASKMGFYALKNTNKETLAFLKFMFAFVNFSLLFLIEENSPQNISFLSDNAVDLTLQCFDKVVFSRQANSSIFCSQISSQLPFSYFFFSIYSF